MSGASVDFPAGAKTYKLTSIFPAGLGEELDLVVKYQAADVSNTAQAYQDNIALIKALLQSILNFGMDFPAWSRAPSTLPAATTAHCSDERCEVVLRVAFGWSRPYATRLSPRSCALLLQRRLCHLDRAIGRNASTPVPVVHFVVPSLVK